MSVADLEARLVGHGATLTRAWPRSPEHLLLEVEHDGATTAGQWFADPGTAHRVAAGTPGGRRLDDHVLLQAGGADRRLPELARLVAEPDTELVAHRPERRGVLRRTTPDGVEYLKVVRPAALDGLVEAVQATAQLPVATPALLAVDRARSATTTAALPGGTLREVLGRRPAEALAACRATGRALARVHAAPVPDRVATHTARQEVAVLQRWVRHARSHGVASADLADRVAAVSAALEQGPVGPPALLHRDLHDKQVLVDDGGEVGLLDFDLLACGEAALDLGNLLVHLDLRAAQGLLAEDLSVGALRAAVLAGYRPTPAVLARTAVYEEATRVRLAAVYGFRPRWREAAAGLR